MQAIAVHGIRRINPLKNSGTAEKEQPKSPQIHTAIKISRYMSIRKSYHCSKF